MGSLTAPWVPPIWAVLLEAQLGVGDQSVGVILSFVTELIDPTYRVF